MVTNHSGSLSLSEAAVCLNGPDTGWLFKLFAQVQCPMTNEERAKELMQKGLRAQHEGRFDLAVSVFDEVLSLDPSRETAHNSKGLSLKYAGKFDEAIEAYNTCLDALFSNLFYRLNNSSASPIYPYREIRGNVWMSWATKTALYTSCHQAGISSVEWPTGQSAEIEARDRTHGGLLWFDRSESGLVIRQFLPNYFHTMREELKSGKTFSRVLNNIGGVHLARSKTQDAIAAFFEAIAFISDGDPYDDPFIALYELKQLN